MAGLLGRLIKAPKALMNSLLTPAEDPRRGQEDADHRQQALLADVRQSLADVGRARLALQARTREVRATLLGLESQASQHLAGGREDLARAVLLRRRAMATELHVVEAQTHEIEREEDRLAIVEQRLAAQIAALSARKEIVAARYSAAEAQVKVGEALGDIMPELSDLRSSLEQAESATEDMQARALAIGELVDAGATGLSRPTGHSEGSRELDDLDANEAVDAQLIVLRRRLAANQGRSQE